MSQRRLERAGVGLIAALAVMLFGAAAANAVFLSTDYKGHARGMPNAFVGFDFGKASGGHHKVFNVSLAGLPYTCKGGTSGESPPMVIDKNFRLQRGRKFSGTAHTIVLGQDPVVRIEGKLRSGGKAVGALKLRGALEPDKSCHTDELGWKAKTLVVR